MDAKQLTVNDRRMLAFLADGNTHEDRVTSLLNDKYPGDDWNIATSAFAMGRLSAFGLATAEDEAGNLTRVWRLTPAGCEAATTHPPHTHAEEG